jgi:hypothetical protein
VEVEGIVPPWLSGQVATPHVERARIELLPEGDDAIFAISLEDVLDHLDVAVVVEREIHVRAADEVDGRALADRAADCKPELFGCGRFSG